MSSRNLIRWITLASFNRSAYIVLDSFARNLDVGGCQPEVRCIDIIQNSSPSALMQRLAERA